jgi:hypothetical protein
VAPSFFPKAPLTDYVLSVIKTLGFPVGDANRPDAPHGWQGDPNDSTSTFIPWITVMPGQAGTSSGPMDASQADWRMPYYFTMAGVHRDQTEMLSDLVRKSMVAQQRAKVPAYEETWSIVQARVVSVGGITRQSAVNPSYYLQTDTVEIWYSKELS